MSNVSPSQSDFDFWDFVACAKCQLPFVSDPPQIPFWLTECGHIICNSHLNTDQSCAHCGAQDIQLAPLQRNMDAPMSEWFRSLPHMSDGLASATKFQLETMALQLRYHRDKHRQYRAIVERVQREIAENKALRKTVEQLSRENEELRQHLGFYPASDQQGRGTDFINANGKRQRTGQQQNLNGIRTGTSSSPRSVPTPLGPNRLTLPPGQEAPNFSARQVGEDGASSYSDPSGNPGANAHPAQQRPGSSRFAEQFAYATPQTPHFHPPKLSHAQAAPLRQFQRSTSSREQGQIQLERAMMPPPPLPPASRFHSAQGRASRQGKQQNLGAPEQCQMDTGPRAMPQRSLQPFGAKTQRVTHQRTQALNTTGMQADTAVQPSRRPFIAPTSSNSGSQRFAFPPTSSGTNQRFVPPTPSNSSSHHVAAGNSSSGSRAPSRSANMEPRGQRMPFIPHG